MTIGINEAAAILRQIISGEMQIKPLDGLAWGDVIDPTFTAGGHTLTFVDDGDELDYLERMVHADGRSAGLDEWWDEAQRDPVGLLTGDERDALERILKATEAPSPLDDFSRVHIWR